MAAIQMGMAGATVVATPLGARTIAQLDFDAWPLVDNVSGHSTTHFSLTSGSVVSSPVISGSTNSIALVNGSECETTPNSTDPALGVDGLTFEGFIRRSPGGSGNWYVELGAWTTALRIFVDIGFSATNSDYLEAQFYDCTIYSTGADNVVSYALPDDTWVHVAACIDVDKFRVFVGGTRVVNESITVVDPAGLAACSFSLLSASFSHSGGGDTVYVDSLRMRAGALYTVDFTPPTAQFAFP